jgi:hypothetical protein
MESERIDDHPILREVAGGETVQARARMREAELVVTEHRLAVASADRLMLDIPIDGLRRIQFDIERTRPATLVVVPEQAGDEPQVLAVPPEQFPNVTRALSIIGQRLAGLDPGRTT